MGSRTWAVGIIWGMVVAAPAFAQVMPGKSPPPQVIGKPLDMSKVVAPYPKPNNPSALSRFFHNLNPANLFSKRSQTNAAPKSSAGPLAATGSLPSAKGPNSLPLMLPIPGH